MTMQRARALRHLRSNAALLGTVLALVAALIIMLPLSSRASADTGLPETVEFVPTTDDSVPFLSHATELADVGWVEEEYFVGGVGNVYEYDAGGAVQVQSADEEYKTRLLIRRPAKTQHSNGLVVVEWLNPTAGFDVEAHWTYQNPYFIREGITYVGVTQRTVTVDFLAGGIRTATDRSQCLRKARSGTSSTRSLRCCAAMTPQTHFNKFLSTH